MGTLLLLLSLAADPYSLTVAGHGIEATPVLPVGAAQLPGGTLIFGPMNAQQAKAQGRVRNVLLKPGKAPRGELKKGKLPGDGSLVAYSTGEEGTTMAVLGSDMDSYDGVLQQLRTADRPAGWLLVTADYELRWPEGFTLRADGDLNPRSWPWELGLGGSTEELVYLQGPLAAAQVPKLEQLVAADMKKSGGGELKNKARWIEASYEHGGAQWVQRTYWLSLASGAVYLLRAQVKKENAAKALEAVEQMAAAFKARR